MIASISKLSFKMTFIFIHENLCERPPERSSWNDVLHKTKITKICQIMLAQLGPLLQNVVAIMHCWCTENFDP